jgi:tetratricopeptide (TPR) repeat protein
MRRPRVTIVLPFGFFLLIVGSLSSIFAQEPTQPTEKERGIELYRKGDFNGAVKTLKEVVKKQGDDSDAWYYLGLSSHRAGKINDARKAFEKAISLRSSFAPAYTALAYMQLLSNDNKGAVKNAEKALALDPKNFESLYIAGMARLKENAPADALGRAEEILKIKRDYPQALLLKTQALVNMFAKEQSNYSLLKAASKSLEAYIELNPDLSERSLWNEQLEAMLYYAQLAEDSDSDKSVTAMTSNLRPTILYREKAHYTDAALNAEVQGVVILRVVFADDGALKHILAIRGLSHGLTAEAIKAARKIRFTPGMRDGKPVSLIGSLEFTFNPY